MSGIANPVVADNRIPPETTVPLPGADPGRGCEIAESEPVAVAAHEAGHAVAMPVHGWPLDRVYIRDPFGDGHPEGLVARRAGAAPAGVADTVG